MTRERIEEFRKVLLPFVKKWLLRINYENRGKSDAEEFEKDFNEILDLAIKALEQEPRWIPVEERLPEEQGLYLVTIKSGDKYYIDTDLYNTLYKKGFRTPNVIAWMPLPQPYSEVTE